MAKLADETLTVIFSLQRKLAGAIERASATEWMLFEQYGETEATIPELEELQSTRERLISSYSRLSGLFLRILEAQPSAPKAIIDLLTQTIEHGQLAVDSAQANTQEIKRNWNLK